jgi:ribonucleoside-diphosphate reductase alpha chain
MTALTEAQSSVLSPQASASPEPSYIERIIEKIVERPLRQRLPDTRRSITHRFNVAGHEGYLTVGLYDDGRPGELFITMSKEGSTIGGLMDSLGTAISVALQYGVPVESLVNKFAHQRFEPQGMTSNRDIPFAKSLVDYIFRWMGMEFIPGYREQNAPKRTPSPGPTTPPTPPEPADRLASSTMTTTLGDRGLSAHAHDSHDHDHHHDRGGNGGVVEAISTRHSEEVMVRSGEVAVEAVVRTERTVAVAATSASALDQANAALMGDAPPCGVCGAITVRNGTCYKCLNCGASMGCS